MKLDLLTPRSSSFFSSATDLQKITTSLIENKKLLKLLKYSVPDALSRPDISIEEALKMMHKNIKVVPKLPFEELQESTIIVSFDSFITNQSNPEYRDNAIVIDVLCPIETWVMDDYMLRPYKIMHEIDLMLNRTKLNGIGRVEFVSANSLLLSDELAGFSVMYRVINDV